jgi:hypothetical protein
VCDAALSHRSAVAKTPFKLKSLKGPLAIETETATTAATVFATAPAYRVTRAE